MPGRKDRKERGRKVSGYLGFLFAGIGTSLIGWEIGSWKIGVALFSFCVAFFLFVCGIADEVERRG